MLWRSRTLGSDDALMTRERAGRTEKERAGRASPLRWAETATLFCAAASAILSDLVRKAKETACCSLRCELVLLAEISQQVLNPKALSRGVHCVVCIFGSWSQTWTGARSATAARRGRKRSSRPQIISCAWCATAHKPRTLTQAAQIHTARAAPRWTPHQPLAHRATPRHTTPAWRQKQCT